MYKATDMHSASRTKLKTAILISERLGRSGKYEGLSSLLDQLTYYYKKYRTKMIHF